MVRRARTRNLLSRRHARLLPHARLRPRCERLPLPDRGRERRRTQRGARKADDRDPASDRGNVEAVLAIQAEWEARDRPLRAEGPMKRTFAWLGAVVLVVLGSRTIVYAISPSPLAAELSHQAGGPALPVIAVVAVLLAVAMSAAVVSLAALGVRQRRLLRPQPPVPRPAAP